MFSIVARRAEAGRADVRGAKAAADGAATAKRVNDSFIVIGSEYFFGDESWC